MAESEIHAGPPFGDNVAYRTVPADIFQVT